MRDINGTISDATGTFPPGEEVRMWHDSALRGDARAGA